MSRRAFQFALERQKEPLHGKDWRGWGRKYFEMWAPGHTLPPPIQAWRESGVRVCVQALQNEYKRLNHGHVGKPRPAVGGSCLSSWFQAQQCLLNRAHSAEELPVQGQGRKAQGGKQMLLCWGALPSTPGPFEGWEGAQEEARWQPWRASREEEARRRMP